MEAIDLGRIDDDSQFVPKGQGQGPGSDPISSAQPPMTVPVVDTTIGGSAGADANAGIGEGGGGEGGGDKTQPGGPPHPAPVIVGSVTAAIIGESTGAGSAQGEAPQCDASSGPLT